MIHDPETGITLAESGAILVYLAERTGRFIPESLQARYEAEARRILGVLDGRLAGRSGIAGDYGVADIAIWPWIESGRRLGLDVDSYPNLARWYAAVGARSSMRRGMAVPAADAPRPFAA